MRPLLSVTLIGFALFGTSAFLGVLSSSPAFHGGLRQADVYGNQVPILSASMYNYPRYLLQLGTTYVRADLLPSGDTEDLGDYANTEVALARADTAVDVLTRSLEHGPSNAMTWETLSWAYFMSGQVDEAAIALEASWALAPYNARLANQRLSLFAGLQDALGETELSDVAHLVENDLETLAFHSRDDFEFHLSELTVDAPLE